MQLLKKFKTKHRIVGVVIDIFCGGAASLALAPFFILPALFCLGLPVWRVIHANNRFEAASIFGRAGLGWFLASTFWVSHALIVSAPSLWFLTPFMALATSKLWRVSKPCCSANLTPIPTRIKYVPRSPCVLKKRLMLQQQQHPNLHLRF